MMDNTMKRSRDDDCEERNAIKKFKDDAKKKWRKSLNDVVENKAEECSSDVDDPFPVVDIKDEEIQEEEEHCVIPTQNQANRKSNSNGEIPESFNSVTKPEVNAKDKIIHLPDGRTMFEFAVPKRKVVLQLKSPKVEQKELKTQTLRDLIDSLRTRHLITSNTETLLETLGVLPHCLEKIKMTEKGGRTKIKMTEKDGETKKKIPPKDGETKQKMPEKEGETKKFSEEVEKLASILYLSPQAFDLVGTVFRLPEKNDVKTKLSVRNFRPGFTQESIDLLKYKLSHIGNCEESNGEETLLEEYCGIMIDIIDLKKHHSYDRTTNRWIGHVEFGSGQEICDCAEIPLASEVVMLTAIGLGKTWKIPFGYFLSRNVAGEDLQHLLTEAISVLESCCRLSVKVLVCDGSVRCVKMAKLLGCNIQVKSFKELATCFPHPSIKGKLIHLVFGYHQTLTLLKHLLADKSALRSKTYGIIKWKFLNQLFGENEGGPKDCVQRKGLPSYRVNRKNGPRDGSSDFVPGKENHTRFSNDELIQLMKTISLCSPEFTKAMSSVLKVIQKRQLDEFSGCEGTVRFVADICRAHDLLNSRNPTSEEKPPLSLFFLDEQIESMSIIGKRIFDMEQLYGEPIVNGGRWMSVALLAFTLKSVASLSPVLLHKKGLEHFPTSRLNLDHSAIILRCIQKRGGWDCAPTAAQFKKGYETLLTEAISVTSHSNVFVNDFEGEDLTIGQGVSVSFRNTLSHQSHVKKMPHSLYLPFVDYQTDLKVTARYIMESVSKNLSCSDCVQLMLQEDDLNVGINPSCFLFKIIQKADHCFQQSQLKCRLTEEHLVRLIFSEYFELNNGFRNWNQEHVSEEPYHAICLIKVIIRTFLKLRMYNANRISVLKTYLMRSA